MKVSRGESLDRYYLFKLLGYGLFLHKIHHSDPVGLFHTHPWDSISFHLRAYSKLIFDRHTKRLSIHRRRWLNYLPAKRFHAVTIGSKPVWTLLFHWPLSNVWSVIDEEGHEVLNPWEGEGSGRSYSKAIRGT